VGKISLPEKSQKSVGVPRIRTCSGGVKKWRSAKKTTEERGTLGNNLQKQGGKRMDSPLNRVREKHKKKTLLKTEPDRGST